MASSHRRERCRLNPQQPRQVPVNAVVEGLPWAPLFPASARAHATVSGWCTAISPSFIHGSSLNVYPLSYVDSEIRSDVCPRPFVHGPGGAAVTGCGGGTAALPDA